VNVAVVWIKRLALLIVVSLVGLALVSAFLPKPVRVDVETLQPGPLEVAVRDDGRTRLRERYVVSTPISGRLRRIALKVGDRVQAGETVVAQLEPTSPTLLDPRERALAQARVKAAEGRQRRTQTELARARDSLEQAKVELERVLKLRAKQATTETQYEQAQLDVRIKSEELRSVEFLTEIAQYELEQEQAALLHVTREEDEPGDAGGRANVEFNITSPITGRVLRVMQESSAVLTAGAALLELGDPNDLEVVVDVLSSDAVRIQPGQRTYFEHWGGPEPLRGAVRLVEPSGFTKISALGVEEQRVNVIIDFTDSLGKRMTLGDGFRVEARIIVWESDHTLSVPTGSLFRAGEDWGVFVVERGRAALRRVEIGENNGLRAQILSGLAEGDQVILHPSDQIADGVAIQPR
jgi:HlyD family secretion protein